MPRIGIAGRLVGEAGSWSGIPAGLAEALRRSGHDTFYLWAEPPPRVQSAVKAWLRATGRMDPSWAQTFEMMQLRTAVAAARRHLHAERRRTRYWVQMGSEFGHPLGRSFITFDDMTVPQALSLPGYVPLRPQVAAGWIRRQAKIYQRACTCCTASHWGASGVREYGVEPGKVRAVGFGSNLEVDGVARDWARPRYLFVGLDWERKNGESVVRAFAALRSSVPDATLDLVGDHPRVDQPGVSGHGPLPLSDRLARSHLESLLSRSTCLVVPSTFEPFGIVYVEAGRAGAGSIGTTVGGAADAIGAGGFVVDPARPDQLLAAMRQMARPEVAGPVGAAARDHARLLTWDAVAARVASALGLPGAPEAPDLPPGRPRRV